MTTDISWTLKCVDCDASYAGLDLRYRCDCGGTLDVAHDLDALRGELTLELFDSRLGAREAVDRSGVWRFRELVLPLAAEYIVTKPEGNTNLYRAASVDDYAGVSLALKHEGENPSGSFKDRGMTVGASVARRMGMCAVACASTGNTAASMASYARAAGFEAAYVFIPAGQIAYGKLSQALAYGARTIQIDGDFDRAMELVQQVCDQRGIYLLNSINPFRIEGQKAIAFELLQDLGWQVPDWIALPGGNLGNSSALGKGLMELLELGLIPRLPRLAVIQATGANPLFTAFTSGQELVPVPHAATRATAIKIGNPISWKKSLRGIHASEGVVTEVDDQQIMDAKAQVDAAGIGAEPASCATVAGVKRLVAEGVIKPGESVCGVLTGHLLKDPDAVVGYHRDELDDIKPSFANAPVQAAATLEGVLAALE